jgi:hypothetical protein
MAEQSFSFVGKIRENPARNAMRKLQNENETLVFLETEKE